MKVKLIRIVLCFLSFVFLFSECSTHKKILKMKYKFETSYNQFYIINPTINHNDNNDLWSEENYKNRIVALNGFIAVRTASYGNIDLELLVLESENKNFDRKEYDHIVEASIKVEGGKLEIVDCPDSDVVTELKLNDSDYRIRLYSKDILDVDEDEDDGSDTYKIEIWADSYRPVKVIKP